MGLRNSLIWNRNLRHNGTREEDRRGAREIDILLIAHGLVVHATTYFSKLKLLLQKKEQKRRKDGSDVATGMNYDVHFRVGLSLYSMYASEMGITRINEPWKTIALLFEGEHLGTDKPTNTYLPQSNPLSSHMVG